MDFDLDEYEEVHRANWAHFIKLTIYGSVAVVAILVLMAIFIL